MEVRRSALKHGIEEADIRHAIRHAFAIDELEPDEDPPTTIAVGPDRSGNLIEVIWITDNGEPVVIHAMKLRKSYYRLLTNEDPT